MFLFPCQFSHTLLDNQHREATATATHSIQYQFWSLLISEFVPPLGSRFFVPFSFGMAAETGFCKVAPEVAGNAGISGLDTCSTHDFPKPNRNGMDNEDLESDPDSSYVFVTEADADSFEIKVVAAVDVSSVLEAKSFVEHFELKTDVDESLMGGKNGMAEAIHGYPSVINGISAENETSPVDGVAFLDTIEENTLKTKCRPELDAQNGTLDFDNGEVCKPLKEGENGNVERTYVKPLLVNDNTSNQESSMREDASVAKHINEFNTIVSQLTSVEIKFDDEIRALILLASLPDNWEPMRAAVSNSVGKRKLQFNDVRDQILAEKVRRMDSGEGTSSRSALNLENRGRGRSGEKSFNQWHGRSKSRNGKDNNTFEKNMKCWSCGETGHLKKNCKSTKNDANVVTEEVHDALLLSMESPVDSWVMDSGASFHTTGNRDVFDNYIAGDYGKVFMADGKPLEIIVGQLDDEGHKVTFGDGSWKVKKGAMIVARGKKSGTLYMTSSLRNKLAAVDAGANSSLWHSRLGDTSEKEMKMLVSNGKLPELKIVEHKLCEAVFFGKQKKVSFSKEVREPKSADLELWELAMEDVMDSLSSNHMWELSELPEGKKVLHSKWEYRLEYDGSKRYKEILVVKGEKKVIGYTDIFSLVVKLTTIRTVLELMVKEDLHLEQLDVKTMFLHGELDEEMNQSQGFEVRVKEKMADHCCYVKLDGYYIILLIYVDDMLVAGACLEEIDKLGKELSKEFALKDLGWSPALTKEVLVYTLVVIFLSVIKVAVLRGRSLFWVNHVNLCVLVDYFIPQVWILLSSWSASLRGNFPTSSLGDGDWDGDCIQDQIEYRFMKTECGAKAEIKQDGDPKRKIEISELIVAEKPNDRNEKTESVANTERKKAEEQIISKSSSGLEKNQESEAPNLGLVAKSGEEGNINMLSPVNISVQTKDVCEREIILGSTETSQLSFEDVADCHLEENKINFTRLVMERVEDEVAQAPFLNPGLECYPIGNKMETIEVEAQSALGVAGDDVKWSIVPGNRVQCSLAEEKGEAINMDCHLGTFCHQVSKGKIKEFSVFHVENNIQYPKDPGELSYLNKMSHVSMISDNETEGPVLSQSFSALSGGVHESLTEYTDYDVEMLVIASSSSINGAKSHAVENGPFVFNGQDAYGVNSISSGCDPTLETVVHIEKEQTYEGHNAHAGAEVSSWKSEDGTDSHTCTDQEMEHDCHDFSALDNVESTSHVTVTRGVVILDNFVVDEEVYANIIVESAEVKNVGEQLCGVVGSKAETLLFQANEDTGIRIENISKVSSKGSSTDVITGEDVSVDVVPKPFNFFIRIPRFNDEKHKEQLKAAKLEINEKTKLRDAIQAEIQEKRANNQIHCVDYEHAKGETRSLRNLLALKRMEISSLRSLINKAKNAISIEDIDSRITNIEHMIQHESLPLREEKELIREIKQLKQLREQLSCNMGSQSEIQQALEQREDAEERLKILRKELATLKDRMSIAQTAIVEAENKYDIENKKIKELQAQFRAADDIRRAAYARWLTLREQLSQKVRPRFNMHVFTFYYQVHLFPSNHQSSQNFLYSSWSSSLLLIPVFERWVARVWVWAFCFKQPGFMKLWNGNGEFRNEYARFNARSTLRRLGTLDGRSLGPDEKPPNLLICDNKERNDKMVSIPANVDSISCQSVELKQQMSLENVATDVQSMKTVRESKDQLGNSSTDVSGREITDEMQEEDSVKMRRNKEEQIRRDEAETKKKEELRLEQLAKAKEVRENKKRHDEKVQMREELRAELKEKEKEKKLRKKERKKAASASTDVYDNSETSEAVDIVKEEIQVSDNSSCTPTKKPKKTPIASKQNNTKSLPPPFRNRNGKKWQQWMWVSLTSVVVILVFWLGNMGLFANVNLKRHSPGY
ncbi:uncharacterized protein LOC142532523 [Primulina tabacum]|uniref:uncharacterized protein LOC142532523 n=1 Tax=Primulina tabacum TaxID=48773 RepID=UPI003F5AD5A1